MGVRCCMAEKSEDESGQEPKAEEKSPEDRAPYQKNSDRDAVKSVDETRLKTLPGGLVDELEANYQEPEREGETELTVGDAGRYSAARDRSEDASYSQLPQ
jgi:hypothetical protein